MNKIMFNDRYALTKAVLDGTKTMTRRIEKPTGVVRSFSMDNVDMVLREEYDERKVRFKLYTEQEYKGILYPRYQVGDLIAVAQSYKDIDLHEEIGYKSYGQNMYAPVRSDNSPGWNNKLFIQAYLMTHHIKITDVRMERLQAISDEDCMREGVVKKWHAPAARNFYYVPKVLVKTPDDVHLTPQEAYATLIDKIIGKGTWERNPWVVVYEFKRVD